MTDSHALNACFALLDVLRQRHGKKSMVVEHPDELDRINKPVDCIIESNGGQTVAVEHTTIESIENQRKFSSMARRFVRWIEETDAIPSDCYAVLALPVNFFRSFNDGYREQYVRVFRDWINEALPALQTANSNKGVPKEIAGNRFWLAYGGAYPRIYGKISPRISVGDTVEAERIRRIEYVFTAKLPKLARYRVYGTKTLLIFDDADISLSNKWLVQDAIAAVVQTDEWVLPDKIVNMTQGVEDNIVDAWFLKDGHSWNDDVVNVDRFSRIARICDRESQFKQPDRHLSI